MDLHNRRLIFEATYQLICLSTVGVVGFEYQEVRRVVAGTEGRHASGHNVEGLSVQIRTVFDNGQHKGVVG